MEEEILKKIEEQDEKLEEIYRSVEKMRKYFLWTFIITVIVIILPLIGLALAFPMYLKSYNFGALGL